MLREAKEETELDVLIGDTYHSFTYVLEDKEKHYVEILLMATLKNPNQEVILNPKEHSEYKWISNPQKLDGLPIFDLEKRAIEEGFKELD